MEKRKRIVKKHKNLSNEANQGKYKLNSDTMCGEYMFTANTSDNSINRAKIERTFQGKGPREFGQSFSLPRGPPRTYLSVYEINTV